MPSSDAGSHVLKLIGILDSGLRVVIQSANGEEVGDCHRRADWVVLGEIQISANVGGSKLVNKPGAEISSVTQSVVLTIDGFGCTPPASEAEVAGDVRSVALVQLESVTQAVLLGQPMVNLGLRVVETVGVGQG